MKTGIDHLLQGDSLTSAEQREKLKSNVIALLKQSNAINTADTLRKREEEECKLEAFKGSVVVHSASASLLRFKLSMSEGRCWECGKREPSKTSAYARCAQCEGE